MGICQRLGPGLSDLSDLTIEQCVVNVAASHVGKYMVRVSARRLLFCTGGLVPAAPQLIPRKGRPELIPISISIPITIPSHLHPVPLLVCP